VIFIVSCSSGRAIAQAVSRRLPTATGRVRARSGQEGFVVDKVALGQVFSEYFGFPCQSSFHQIMHLHNHLGHVTLGQSVAEVPSGPSWTPPPNLRIKKKSCTSDDGQKTNFREAESLIKSDYGQSLQ
jgi:hypothetical protein